MATLTVYPDAGSGGTTVDGQANRNTAGETFSTIRAGAGTAANTSGLNSTGPWLIAVSTTNQYGNLLRAGETYDTSSLSSSATISSAILSLYYNGKSNGLGSPELDTVSFAPANNNNIVAADFSNFGSTPFASITYANWTAAQYNDFTLDANGIANVSKTGISGFGQRLNWDTDNNFTGTWADSAASVMSFLTADNTGTTTDPKLVITYTLPVTSGNFFALF